MNFLLPSNTVTYLLIFHIIVFVFSAYFILKSEIAPVKKIILILIMFSIPVLGPLAGLFFYFISKKKAV